MDNANFVRQLRNMEIAKRDQSDAQRDVSDRQHEADALIIANADQAFKALQPLAEKLVTAANAHVMNCQYEVFSVHGGFCIKLGTETAGFSYSQVFANCGPVVRPISATLS